MPFILKECHGRCVYQKYSRSVVKEQQSTADFCSLIIDLLQFCALHLCPWYYCSCNKCKDDKLIYLILLKMLMLFPCRYNRLWLYFHRPVAGFSLLVVRDFLITHNDAPQSVGLLWTSGHSVVETSTWQHTILTTDRHPCPRWDSNPPSQQASGRRPTLQTARPLGPAFL